MQFRFLPAFFDHPPQIRFSEQEHNEIVELFLRQHGITNVPWIVTVIIAIFLPALIIQADIFFNLNFLAPLPTNIIVGGLVIYYMLLLAYTLEQFLHWYFNIYIVTNLHVVDISFDSVLSRNITEFKISDIESVSSTIAGIFGSLFNYGNVKIETAANTLAAMFENVPRPDIVADRIQDIKTGSHRDNSP